MCSMEGAGVMLGGKKGLSKLRLPRWCSGKEPTCQCRRCRRRRFDPWVRKIPWRRKWQPTPVFLPGKSHGQRSLVGCIAWDCKSQTQPSEHAPKINLGTYALNQGKLFSPFRTSPNHRNPSLHWDVRMDIQVESHPHI